MFLYSVAFFLCVQISNPGLVGSHTNGPPAIEVKKPVQGVGFLNGSIPGGI